MIKKKSKKIKKQDIKLQSLNKGQAKHEKIEENVKKERIKRVKEKKQIEEQQSYFDEETETVINMTNKNKLKQDEIKSKKMATEQRKRKKKIKRIKTILKVVIGIGIIAGGITFAMISPIFNIKDIKVLNNVRITSDTIISTSQINIGQNIFRFSVNNAQDNIKENPYIDSVEVKRLFPNTIEINVQERVAKYSVEYMGKYAYVNTQGYILEISDDSKELTHIKGISTSEDDVVPGKRLNNIDLAKIEDTMKIMNVFKENNLDSKVTSIDISDKNEYIIYIEEEQKKIHIGDTTNLSNKMLYVVSMIQEENVAGDIFVNGDFNNKFKPYFRQQV